MAIPYRTGKFKSANILVIAILGSTAKFNSHQYFRLYGISVDFVTVHARIGHAGAAEGGGAFLHTQLLQCSSLSQSPQPSGCMGGHTHGRWIATCKCL